MESDQHHVHFEAADVLSHDNSMIIKQPEEGKIDIHVGFLQVLHKYEVVASVPSAFLPNSEKIVPSTDTQLSNLFVRYHTFYILIQQRKKPVSFFKGFCPCLLNPKSQM